MLDHITNALSSLLTNVNTQQTMAQDTGKVETDLLGAAKTRAVVTQAKRRRIGQLLRRASQQTALLKRGSLAPGEVHLPGMKEQPHPCTDTAERGTIQVGFSARYLGLFDPGANLQRQRFLGIPSIAVSTSSARENLGFITFSD